MSGGKGQQGVVAPAYTGLQLQTSSGIVVVPLSWGAMRGAPNVIWYGDFSAKAQHAKGGKGGGPVTGYDYHASLLEALSQGPIHGIGKTWLNNGNAGSITQTKFSLISLGTTPQAPWSYLVSNFPLQADSYNGVALVGTIKIDLGSSPYAPQQSYEILGLRWNTAPGGNGDADCALVVQDFLSNFYWSVGLPASVLGNLLSTSSATSPGDATFQTYCTAMGFGISPNLASQEDALTILDRWTQLTNTAMFWSGYALKFVPRGDQTVSGNGVIYLPDLTPVYSLTDDQLVHQDNTDPIIPTRTDPADAFNNVRITIKDRTNWYEDRPVELQDDGLVAQYGVRQMNSVQASEVADPVVGLKMVELLLARAAYQRNSYEFELSSDFCLLEPMDVLELTDPILGTFTCRITSMEETDTGSFKIVAEQLNIGISSNTTGGTPQSVSNTPQNQLVVPGAVNTPVIFEPPSTLAGQGSIWIAASAGPGGVYDPNYGGCVVNVSSDGATYGQLGTMYGPSRQGVLTAGLAAYGGANPDTVNTLTVDLAESDGMLTSTTSLNAAAGVNLCWVDGELISFETATLVSGNKYNLTNLWRGLYGTTPGAHLTATQFAKLDDGIGKFVLPTAYIGDPIYVKLQSFNNFGQEIQDISTCTAYPYTPSGASYGGGAGGVPTTPTGLTATGGAGAVTLSWNANPTTDNAIGYILFRAPGIGSSFGSAIQIWEGNALAHIDTPLPASTGYTYFLEAVNMVGDSAHTAGVNATTGSSSGGSMGTATSVGAIGGSAPCGYLYSSSGAAKVTVADNTTGPPNLCNVFVATSYGSGVTASYFFPGQLITGLSLTPGLTYYLGAGGALATAPGASGTFSQVIGTTDESGNLFFNPGAIGQVS
jgi:hypothetical protein